VITTGSIDFVRDYGNAVSALFTCELLGLPAAEWRELAEPIHERAYTVPGTPANDRAVARFQACVDRARLIIAERREKPADDLISVLVQSELDGVPISDEIVANICRGLVSGGFGTTASLVANILWYLGEHPHDRQRLIDDPALLPAATEEFLRYFTPSPALARTVTRDVDLGSCPLRHADRVLISWAGANRDPGQFDRPGEIVIDRFPNRHVAFGTGLHRCLGSNFARVELSSMVSEVLRRIPDYTLVSGESSRYPSIGVINGWISLPATFTPGPAVQDRRLP
jgi:cytochrome P450